MTKLDCFRYCRFLRHVGKVGKLGAASLPVLADQH